MKKYEYKGLNGYLIGRFGLCLNEVGMFIYVMINGVKVKMLVDIGVIVIMLLLVLMKVVGEYCEV